MTHDYVNEHLAKRNGKRHASPLVCKDGTHFSIQASDGHYCSPKDRVGPYTSVEVVKLGKPIPTLGAWGKPNERYQGGLWGFLSVVLVNEEIERRGGLKC